MKDEKEIAQQAKEDEIERYNNGDDLPNVTFVQGQNEKEILERMRFIEYQIGIGITLFGTH